MILKGDANWLEINVLKRSYPQSTDYWDGNWLESEIKIDVPGFKGLYSANLRADDFERFDENLEKLKTNQSKEIEFTTMEDGLYLKGLLDLTGIIKWNGMAKSLCGNSCLTFVIKTDYASIDNLLKQVQEILNKYPVLGDKDQDN